MKRSTKDILIVVLILVIFMFVLASVLPVHSTDPTYVVLGSYTSGINGKPVIFIFDRNTLIDILFPACPRFVMMDDSSSAFVPGYMLVDNTCRRSKMLG